MMGHMMTGKTTKKTTLKATQRSESVTASSLEPLEKALYLKLKDFRNILEGRNIIIAVSGGIDSIILLHALAKLQGRLAYKLHVVHVNHGVRAKEADTDEEFVKEIAAKLKVPVITHKLKIPLGKASENNLREKRYHILFAEKKKLNASVIITAHHRDDLIETRLMRLLQGTGIHGLKAMTFLSSDEIMRPLLELSRRDIEDYAKKLNLRWRNDATNSDTTKFRNWIRRNWIARLKMDHPGYVDNLFESLERLVRQSEALETAATKKDFTYFSREHLINQSTIKVEEEIYNFLRHNTVDRVTSQHVAEFKKRLETNRKKFIFRLAGQDWTVDAKRVVPAS